MQCKHLFEFISSNIKSLKNRPELVTVLQVKLRMKRRILHNHVLLACLSMSVCLSSVRVCLSVCLSVCPSSRPSICLFVCVYQLYMILTVVILFMLYRRCLSPLDRQTYGGGIDESKFSVASTCWILGAKNLT